MKLACAPQERQDGEHAGSETSVPAKDRALHTKPSSNAGVIKYSSIQSKNLQKLQGVRRSLDACDSYWGPCIDYQQSEEHQLQMPQSDEPLSPSEEEARVNGAYG